MYAEIGVALQSWRGCGLNFSNPHKIAVPLNRGTAASFRSPSQMRLNIPRMPMEEDQGSAVVEKAESRAKLERPPLYRVLLHNDDFTTMEFVVFVLQNVFNHGESEAVQIMLNVHRQGIGLAGVYTYEVAEMKVDKVTNLAQANEFPLLCTIEEDESQSGNTD